MKITASILSIPPYLSTTWENISSLHVRETAGGAILIVFLQNGASIEVPNLAKEHIDEIFEAHARTAEKQNSPKIHNPLEGPFSFSLPLKGDGLIDTFGSSIQHNAEHADLPSLPPEFLKKITMIARAFGLDEAISKAEPHCNCVYCQIARSLKGGEVFEQVEEINDEDLKFRNWEIVQTGDNLYTATNPLDANEYYTIFLGTPLGCTCGSKNCEHIRAVLSS